MFKVTAKNWQGVVMNTCECETASEARDFINNECLGHWSITREKVDL